MCIRDSTISVKDENEGNKDIVIQNICENYMGHYLYMTPKYYEKVYGEKPEYNTVLFSVQDSYTRQQMEEAGEKILARDEVLSLSYMKDIEKRLNDMLKSLNLVIIVLLSLIHIWMCDWNWKCMEIPLPLRRDGRGRFYFDLLDLPSCYGNSGACYGICCRTCK